MLVYDKLLKAQQVNSSILCIGLDSDLNRMPEHLKSNVDNIFEFNKKIIDATKDLVCCYKLNFAFYEQFGVKGYEILKKTFDIIPDNIVKIADAKRGDIANTASAYAKCCYDYFGADSVTVNPYMGKDSVEPFLEHKKKMVFLLALTSNPGSANFQHLQSQDKPVYKHVVSQSSRWGDYKNMGYVIGANHPDELDDLRQLVPNRVFLIPGVGAQGGSVEATLKANAGGPAIINVSRTIIFASTKTDFAEKAREKAYKYKLSFM
ncbi:MAG: orotidine-5'-phosphate decarboxylase [Bacteroidota bacterium]